MAIRGRLPIPPREKAIARVRGAWSVSVLSGLVFPPFRTTRLSYRWRAMDGPPFRREDIAEPSVVYLYALKEGQ